MILNERISRILAWGIVLVLAPFVMPERPVAKGYWVWHGGFSEAAMRAETLYIHQGNFDVFDTRGVYQFQGPVPQAIPGHNHPVILTYRLERQVAPGMVVARYRAHSHAWERRGVKVGGIQIDYDSPTARLPKYARWLGELKTVFGGNIALSVTGLGDWLMSGQYKDLSAISDQVEFIAFMMYWDNRPLPGLENYTDRLAKLSLPFYLGRLSNQNPTVLFDRVRAAPGYQGDIVFPYRLYRKANK
ncbi:MAG: DUF3142 domain-containing protein [Rhodospirillaceae bacterium]|jgi:hypothetical protein|nr:DUF3142 domain-containing protein [Rhodospirillaceae bacterium]MBT5192140.1 DUF3142 domain-containing protein [Rhodospirillaceae bacterium]MBT6429585.1 DUF3142 domain-containing protein [Rhodospirillaceae bacterium]MBT7760385.1 DUF3142 domain-containing protein [Rhodospirillaceae bacterium]